MILTIALTLHFLSVLIWVGGMFFAHMILRPVATHLLEPSLRLPLLSQVFSRFFIWVWLAIILLWITGGGLIWNQGGFSQVGIFIHIMLVLGSIMTLLFMYLFFIPFSKLKQAVAQHNFPTAAIYLGQIRWVVATNLLLGFITILIAKMGRYLI